MSSKTPKSFLATSLGLAVAGLCAGQAQAAAPFTENAGNPYYDSGWQFGSSQPNNFGWFTTTSVTAPGIAGRFLGDSQNLATGTGGDINSNERSWGMFGQSGGSGSGQSDAYGFLKDGAGNDAALGIGQTLSLDIAVNWRNGYKGFAARNAGGTELFTFNIGGDDHTVSNAASGNGSIGNAYSSNTVFHISLTQTSASGGTWTITRSGGISDSDAGTYSGEVWNFKLYIGQTDGAPENDLYANHVSVTDSTLAITGTTRLEDGSFQLDFSGFSGGSFKILANSDLDTPVNTWTELGTATETPANSGQFQFVDSDAPNHPRRFYVVKRP